MRGLDVNRVGIVDNGIGGGGVSDLGEDHFVPVDPITSDRIEVIRGPATLRYGSQSIGGVVSSSNNRIPEQMPCPPAVAMSKGCAQFETRTAFSSVDRGVEGAMIADIGARSFAFHGDVFGRSTRFSSSGSRRPSRSGVSSVTSTPCFSSRFAGTTIDLCSIADGTR